MLTLPLSDQAAFEAQAGAAAVLLRALANERRLLILCQLGEGELSVGALQERLDVSQSVLRSIWQCCAMRAWSPRVGSPRPFSIA